MLTTPDAQSLALKAKLFRGFSDPSRLSILGRSGTMHATWASWLRRRGSRSPTSPTIWPVCWTASWSSASRRVGGRSTGWRTSEWAPCSASPTSSWRRLRGLRLPALRGADCGGAGPDLPDPEFRLVTRRSGSPLFRMASLLATLGMSSGGGRSPSPMSTTDTPPRRQHGKDGAPGYGIAAARTSMASPPPASRRSPAPA